MPDYALFLLGPPRLERAGRPVKFEMRKALALLAYLRLSSGPVPRDILAALLWPEHDQPHAQASLRRTLASLNGSLLPGLLLSDRQQIGLLDPSQIWLDLETFHASIAQVKAHPHPVPCPACLALLESAVAAYQGDFLAGFNLAACPEFDHWQTVQRESARQSLDWALQQLATGHAAQGSLQNALEFARRRVELDPLNEPAQAFYRRLQTQPPVAPSPEPPPPPRRQSLTAAEPLLKVKLYIPALRGARVPRPRLTAQLAGIARHPLTVLSAPAGFGKTTALTAWLAHTSLPAGWVALDDGDNDLRRFLTYLVAAIDSVHPAAGETAFDLLSRPELPPAGLVLTTLLHALEGRPGDFILVLDDYQFITNPAIHSALTFLLDHLPAQMHLVIATRVDPPFGLARYRSRQALLEVRTHHLRFTAEESHQYLNDVMRLELSPADVAALKDRTEGWIAGLQMAALSLKDQPDRAGFVQAFSGSNRYILDYLVEEVLTRQPPAIQSFLLHTAVLDRLSGPLCDALLDRPAASPPDLTASSQSILEYLERSNLFLLPLDDERRWFRYHHLFHDLLLARLQQAQPAVLPRLQTRAADWCLENGLLEEALAYAHAARDYDRMAAWIAAASNDHIPKLRSFGLTQWIKRLPPALVRSNPWFSILCAWESMLRGDKDAAIPFLDQAEAPLRAAPPDPENQELLGILFSLRAEVLEASHQPGLSAAEVQAVLAHLPHEGSIGRTVASLLLGRIHYRTGDLPRARAIFTELLEQNLQAESYELVALLMSLLGGTYRFEGKLSQAESIYRQAADLMERHGHRRFVISGTIYQCWGDLLRERNGLDGAERLLERGLQETRPWRNLNFILQGLAFLARLRIAQGDLPAALALLQEGQSLLPVSHLTRDAESVCHTTWVRYYLAAGDLPAAVRFSREYEDRLPPNDEIWSEYDLLVFARLRLLSGDLAAAFEILTPLTARLESNGHHGRLIDAQILLAQAFALQGQPDAALAALERALRLAAPEGFVRIFVDEGPPLRTLLDRFLSLRPGHELAPYVRNLIHLFPS